MEHSQHIEHEDAVTSGCHWHPGVETRISCSRCDKFVCPECMVQAPVGIRCRECGKAARMPTYDVRPTYYARAIGVAAAVAVGGGLLWALINTFLGAIPFLPGLIAVGIGYGAGELISLSVNRKRGTPLAWIAGGSVVAAFLVSWVVNPFGFSFWGLILIGFGVFTAVKRVRR